MRPVHVVGVLLCAALSATAARAAGTVNVRFVDPQRYSDVGDGAYAPQVQLDILRRHLERAAAARLQDGQTLTIEVLDVDLAGEVRHGGRIDQLRVLQGRADWPRIDLRYTLATPGQPEQRGEARVQDQAYLERATGLGLETDLRYERRMIDEWFRSRFLAP